MLRIGAERHELPADVIERYRAIERGGPKLSLYLRWLKTPVMWLVPRVGTLCVLSGALALLVLLVLLALRSRPVVKVHAPPRVVLPPLASSAKLVVRQAHSLARARPGSFNGAASADRPRRPRRRRLRAR